MYTCPKCGRNMYAECIDTEFDCDAHYDHYYARCDYCRKEWEWTEIYTLTDITPMVEIDDH